MNGWTSCEACGTIGHDTTDCPFVPDLSVDFDAAARKLLARPRANLLGPHSKPMIECSAGGRELLRRLGRLTADKTVSDCLDAAPTQSVAAEAEPSEQGHREQIMVEGTRVMNLIWKPSEQGAAGKVYVGGLKAATDKAELERYGISHVVNCMNSPSYNRPELGIDYFDFQIELFERYRRKVLAMDDSGGGPVAEIELVYSFFEPVLQFIRHAAENGGHVLIHCFAGAHRAGSTGVAFLMYMEHLRTEDAIATAQCLRPVIDPKAYGNLHKLLCALESAFSHPCSPKATTGGIGGCNRSSVLPSETCLTLDERMSIIWGDEQ